MFDAPSERVNTAAALPFGWGATNGKSAPCPAAEISVAGVNAPPNGRTACWIRTLVPSERFHTTITSPGGSPVGSGTCAFWPAADSESALGKTLPEPAGRVAACAIVFAPLE